MKAIVGNKSGADNVTSTLVIQVRPVCRTLSLCVSSPYASIDLSTSTTLKSPAANLTPQPLTSSINMYPTMLCNIS